MPQNTSPEQAGRGQQDPRRQEQTTPQSTPEPQRRSEPQRTAEEEQHMPQLTAAQRQEVWRQEQEKRRPDVKFRVFHKVRNSMRQGMGKIFLAGLFVIPPLGAAAYAINKTSKATIAKVPVVKYVDQVPRAIISGTAEKAKNAIANVAAVPAVGIDIARGTAKLAGRGLDATVLELYRDFRKAVNHKFNFPPDTNPLAAFLALLKGMVVGIFHIPGNIMKAYGEAFTKSPFWTSVATAMVAGFMTKYGAAGAAGAFVNWVMRLVEGIATKIGTPPPGIPGV